MNRIILLIAGIAIIGLGFISLVEVSPWPKQIWLNLVVTVLVFVINFSNIMLIGQSIQQFRDRIPSLGILWTVDVLYSFTAIGGLLVAYQQHWSYSLSLIVQLSLVFGVIVVLSLAIKANLHAIEIQRSEAITLSSLDEIRSTFATGSVVALRLTVAYPDLHQDITCIGENLRYLSAIPTKAAHELETQIQAELQNLFETLKRATNPDLDLQKAAVQDSLTRAKDLIQQRKVCCNTDDSRGMPT